MRLSISGRVVKSNYVEVSTPRMVEWKEEFQQLGEYVAVLNVEETQSPANLGHSALFDVSALEEEAKEKAARIIAEAQTEARRILAQAQADSERLREEIKEAAKADIFPQAQAEGYQTGHQEGYQAGYQAGFQAGETEGKRLEEKANHLFHLAQRAAQEEFAKVDGDLLHLSVKIAERIVRSSLAVEPERLLGIIRSLTLFPQDRQGWRLHVASEDVSWLQQLDGDQLSCPWVMDEALKPGDCYLECQEGIFDARLEAQLDKLEHTLREELEHGELEPISRNSGGN